MDKYELAKDPFPLPPIGEGKLYKEIKYDMRYVIGAFAALLLLLLGVILFDRRQNALGKDVVHESI